MENSSFIKKGHNGNGHAPVHEMTSHEAAFGYPRDFLQNKFVYLTVSPRAKGLSIGVNLNPVANCNLNCLYCEVDRNQSPNAGRLDVDRLAVELRQTIELAEGGWLRQWPRYAKLPAELMEVRHIALSGDGEPTLSTQFVEATDIIAGVRATTERFFKLVLITNSTSLDQPQVQKALELLVAKDEIWAKLDGGTQEYLNKLNGPCISLGKIMRNILSVARKRPVIIQSLFPAIDGVEPLSHEIKEYAQRLKELKQAGAQIPLVQIYSATRPMARFGCSHLPLKKLSYIAKTVRQIAGLRAEVF